MSVSIEKITFFTLLLFIICLPLLFYPDIFNPYEYPKFIAVVIATQFLTIIFFTDKIIKKELQNISLPILFPVFGTYIIIVLISNIFGLDLKTSLLGSMYRHQGFLLLICLFEITLLTYLSGKSIKKRYEFLGFALIYSTILLCLISFIQSIQIFIFHNHSVPSFDGRIIATMGNPNFLGGYLAALFPISYLALKKHTKKNLLGRYSGYVYGLMVFIAILLTDSRSALLAFGIVLLLLIAKNSRNFAYIAIVLVICFLSFLVLSNQSKRISIWDNRSLVWSYGAEAFLKNPLLGYGQENFELIVNPSKKIKIDSAHNIFLETAVASGIIGLSLFVAILYLALKHATYPIRLALLAILITAQFNPLSIAQLGLFWFLVGFYQKE